MWQDIWQKKGQSAKGHQNISVLELLNINGYDTSSAPLNEDAWTNYGRYVGNYCQIEKGTKSLLEIGCGGGVYLKLFAESNKDLQIHGLDYSQNLIDVAQSVIPNGRFYCAQANQINKIFSDKNFDTIICGGVVIYFPNKEYAFEVIQKSYDLLKTGGNLAFLDLNDVRQKDTYSRVRRGNLSQEEYQQKYQGLEHLFLERSEVFDFVNQLGFQKIIVEDQHIEGYINNPFRFNVFALGKK